MKLEGNLSASSFTPGPWVWGAEKSGSAGSREPKDIQYLKDTGAAYDLSLYGRGQDLCGPVIIRLDAQRFDDFPSGPDAALIVAAPEMYAALEEAVRLMPLGTAKRAAWFGRASVALAIARMGG